MPQLYTLLRNKFYMDDAYQWVINRVVLVVAGVVSWYDRAVVNDTGVNGPADATRFGGFLLKFHETGRMPNYALLMTVGVVVLAMIALRRGEIRRRKRRMPHNYLLLPLIVLPLATSLVLVAVPSRHVNVVRYIAAGVGGWRCSGWRSTSSSPTSSAAATASSSSRGAGRGWRTSASWARTASRSTSASTASPRRWCC